MILGLIHFPDIGRYAVPIYTPWNIGIRWYALSYIAGLLFGWWATARMARNPSFWKNPTFAGKAPITPEQIGDLFFWATLGVVIGGRLGWILFYATGLCLISPQSPMCHTPDHIGLPLDFLYHPFNLLRVWEGGMSFHGGLAGVAVAIWWFCRQNKLQLLAVSDMIAVVAPIGLFFGRIANFINGELWGKPTDVPWAMIFPNAPDHLPRHPSQLYEAFLEGLVLYAILQFALRRFRLHERPGLLTGIFFLGYGAFRFFVEFFREPDGPLLGWFSMGMALSIPLWAAACAFLWIALRPHVNGRS